MQIRGVVYRIRQNAESVLAFGFAEQLLPPFGYHSHLRFIVYKEFHIISLVLQNAAGNGVAISGVFVEIGIAIFAHAIVQTLHQHIDINPGSRNRQQAHGGDHGETSADIIGNDECLIAFFISHGFQGTASLVCGGINAACGLVPVFVFHKLF